MAPYPYLKMQEMIMSNIYLTTGIAAVISFFVFMLILKNKEEDLFTRCKFIKINCSSYLYIALSAISLSFITCKFIALTYDQFESYDAVSKSLTVSWNAISHISFASITNLLCMLVLLPIFEEILFRGILFNEFKKHLNLVISILLQALIFGLFHGNLLQGIYAFVLGIVLALIYTYTNSILSNIVLHVIFNIMGSFIAPLALYYSNQYFFILVFISIALFIFSLVKLHNAQNTEENFLYYAK